MRRSSYHEKASHLIQKNQNRTKHEIDIESLNIKLDINKIQDDNSFIGSKTNRYTHLYKHPIKVTYKRPYTTHRSNSLNQIKKQDFEAKKPASSLNKNHKMPKDLWVSTVKDHIHDNTMNYSMKFHDPTVMQKGRLHRGISLKGEQRSFLLRDYSFDSKKSSKNSSNTKSPVPNQQNPSASYHINQLKQSLYQSSRSKKPNVMDLMGKNLNKSITPYNNRSSPVDNFFEYVMRFSYKTKKGYTPSNPNKINQDSYITSPNINGKSWEHLFGICDGHGPLGHLVSGFIKSTLPQCIANVKNIDKNPIHLLTKCFQNAYEKLIKQSHVDMSFSGSTVVVCYFIQNKLYCCNVGDSRAILGKNKNNSSGSWEAVALSNDHKPSIPSQAQRIKKMKGRVQAYKDQFGQQIGPLRVWLRNDNVPGLAMSRSFGDLVAASVGVSHQPQIKQFNLTEQDKIVLIASDGVFQFLNNNDIIKQLVPFYQKKQIQQASDHLLTLAHRSWNKNSSIIDDITFILIFMNYNEI